MTLRRVLIAVTVALVIVEVGLRWGVGLGDPPIAVLDEQVEYRLVPSTDYTRWGNQISINRHGLRGPDIDVRAEPNGRRVLLIGDSIVYGTHFLDQAETISARLEVHLSKNPRLTDCRPQAIAMGVSSWGPVNQAAFLARSGTFNASVAIILVSAHDLYDVPRGDGADILPYRERPSYTAIGDAFTIVIERLIRRDTVPVQGFFSRAENNTIEALDWIAATLANENIPLTLVFHPTLSERTGAMLPEKAKLLDWAANSDLPVIDLQEMVSEPGGYRDDIHPDAEGANRIAEVLAENLATALLPC